MTIIEWRKYLRELAIDNAFNGRPVLDGVDWQLRPVLIRESGYPVSESPLSANQDTAA